MTVTAAHVSVVLAVPQLLQSSQHPSESATECCHLAVDLLMARPCRPYVLDHHPSVFVVCAALL